MYIVCMLIQYRLTDREEQALVKAYELTMSVELKRDVTIQGFARLQMNLALSRLCENLRIEGPFMVKPDCVDGTNDYEERRGRKVTKV